MLTRALRGAPSSSSSLTTALQLSSATSSTLLSGSPASELLGSPSLEREDTLDGQTEAEPEAQADTAGEDDEAFFLFGEPPSSPQSSSTPAIDAMTALGGARRSVSFERSHRSAPALAAGVPVPAGSRAVPVAAPASANPFAGAAMMARSCPKPIVMPRRGRQGGLAEQDELTVFVPPHEIAASSLMDPTSVAESLCRKGSAALRLRAGVLRRTGYWEGNTEVLRSHNTLSSSFKQ